MKSPSVRVDVAKDIVCELGVLFVTVRMVIAFVIAVALFGTVLVASVFAKVVELAPQYSGILVFRAAVVVPAFTICKHEQARLSPYS